MDTAKWFDFEGQTVVVTGGAGGIGREIAAAFGRHRAHVVVADIDADAAATVAHGIPSAQAVGLDTTDSEAVRRFLVSLVSQRGRVEVLVNTPAVTHDAAALDLTEVEYDEIMRVNVKGTWIPCQMLGRHMVGVGYGRIINYGSNSGTRGAPSHAIYGASKAAVMSMTKSLALEWAKSGVTVNAVVPGPTQTDLMSSATTDPATIASIANRIPQGELTATDVTVGPALFLASRLAVSITGHILFADGGLSAT